MWSKSEKDIGQLERGTCVTHNMKNSLNEVITVTCSAILRRMNNSYKSEIMKLITERVYRILQELFQSSTYYFDETIDECIKYFVCIKLKKVLHYKCIIYRDTRDFHRQLLKAQTWKLHLSRKPHASKHVSISDSSSEDLTFIDDYRSYHVHLIYRTCIKHLTFH